MLLAAAILAVATVMTTSPIELSVPAELELKRRVLSCREEPQREALMSTEPECAYLGRRFGGKSWIGCRKAVEYAITYGDDPAYDKPKISVSREERASMEATTLTTMRDEILGQELWATLYKAGTDEVWLPNGSVIRFFGLDKPGRALGARYAFMFVDQAEQLTNEQFNVAISCCTQPYMPWTQFFTSYNPENPEHWAFKRYRPDLGPGLRSDDRGVFARVVLVGENDFLDILNPSDRDRFERLEGVWRDRLRYGRWVAFSGVVFDSWSPGTHLVARPESWEAWGGFPPPSWERVRSVDFGYNPDPYCFLWAARSPEGKLYVYRQDYRLNLDSNEQAERIRAIDRTEFELMRKTALRAADDPEGEAMRAEMAEYEDGFPTRLYAEHSADSRQIYKKAGIASSPARKEIQAGIESVRMRMSPRQPGGPRLLVVKDCLVERDRELQATGRPTCLEEEVGRYVWKSAKTNAGAQAVKDVPVDENNHALDALRYLVHTHDLTRWS
jgi:hypothetical protein